VWRSLAAATGGRGLDANGDFPGSSETAASIFRRCPSKTPPHFRREAHLFVGADFIRNLTRVCEIEAVLSGRTGRISLTRPSSLSCHQSGGLTSCVRGSLHRSPQSLTMSKPRKKCIFCDNFADSKEHIWAEWMLPHLPKKGVSSHEVYSEVIFSKHSAVTITKRSGEPQSGRLRIVCEDCNTGWMSDLQKAAKHILWGAARIIETPG
jgi:hypothetical protein